MDINNTKSENNFEQVKSAGFEDFETSQTISEQVKYESSVSNKFASFKNSEISQIKSEQVQSESSVNVGAASNKLSNTKKSFTLRFKRFKEDLASCMQVN